MTASLLRALRIVIAADSDPVRQVLFRNLIQARRTVRVAYRLHERFAGTWASAVIASTYGLAYYLRISPPPARLPVLAVGKHANARRQVDRIGESVGVEHYHRIRIGLGAGATIGGLVRLLSPASARALWRSLRILRGVDRRYGFLVACRASAAIGWYARSKAFLIEHRPGAVLVSSDSNPEELGFVAAAATLGVPRIFVAHAYPTPFSPPLNFDLSILEGQAAIQARARQGRIGGDIVLAGVDGESAPFDTSRFERKEPIIGIFAPKAVSWPTLAALIDDCRRECGARRIVIRWHPSRLDHAQHLHSMIDPSGVEESPMSASLPDVARQCDWVIADENSNVHLPVLKLGIPTVVVKGLGLYPDSRADMYGFAAARVVLPPVRSIREVRPAELKAFFDEEWVNRFRQYDASYLRSQADVQAEVRQAIWRLLEVASSSAAARPESRAGVLA